MKQRKQIKQYKKALNHFLSIYKKRINNISNTIAYKELQKDIDNITKLIQQNRIKELNIIKFERKKPIMRYYPMFALGSCYYYSYFYRVGFYY